MDKRHTIQRGWIGKGETGERRKDAAPKAHTPFVYVMSLWPKGKFQLSGTLNDSFDLLTTPRSRHPLWLVVPPNRN